MKTIFALFIVPLLILTACTAKSIPPSNNIINSAFPLVNGKNLEQKSVTLPESIIGKPTAILIGYQQKAQFDIDRWILGLLQAEVPVQILEVPTIAGMMPQMVQEFINNGMRKGIPEKDWAQVITVYEDAEKIISAFGNERPQSARVVLLDRSGRIIWTTNSGYSASAILEIKKLSLGL